MSTKPPRLARVLLRLLVRGEAQEFILGDLDEEFYRRVNAPDRARRARRWYWSQVVRSAVHMLRAARTQRREITSRDAWSRSLLQDTRYAFRTLRTQPGFTSVAVVTLALGIGANTTIFSLVNGVMLRPLTFADPDRLASVWEKNPERGWYQAEAAPANAIDWREQVDAFDDLALYSDYDFDLTLTGVGEPEMLNGGQVSGNIFSVLGVAPVVGRPFTWEETWPESDPVVVLSHDLWQRRFGGDPSIIGRSIVLSEQPHRVIGVMPARFRYLVDGVDLWRPFRWDRTRLIESVWFRQAHVARVVARLEPGVSLQEAQAQLEAVAARLEQAYPETNRFMGAGLTPLREFLIGDVRVRLLLLLGAVGVLLLIACVNVGNLMLVRSIGRQQEFAVRSALGAAGGRIVRQVFTESLLIAMAGAVVGGALGIAGLNALTALAPGRLPELRHVTLDHRVFGFTLGLILLTTLAFGIVPAVKSAKPQLVEYLKERSRSGSPARDTLRAVNAMVALEIALALLLVTGAGLLVRSIMQLQKVDPGFTETRALTFAVALPRETYPDQAARAAFTEALLGRLRSLPGVESVGAVRRVPLTGGGWTSDLAVEGRDREDYGINVQHREATGTYFETLGIPILSGRTFDNRDGLDAPLSVVINAAMADQYFVNGNPIGQRISFDRYPDGNSFWYTIVGVVGNERHTIDVEPRPEIIANALQVHPSTLRYVMRTGGEPSLLAPLARRELAAINPNLPMTDVQTMDDVRASALTTDRFLMSLLGIFAVVALALATVGIYGVTSQAARRRTQEIGIRIALGATAAQISRTVLGRGIAVVAVGVLLGLATAAAGTRIMGTLLYEVAPRDLLTFVAAPLLLAVVGVGASYWPARRATRVDPVEVLRSE